MEQKQQKRREVCIPLFVFTAPWKQWCKALSNGHCVSQCAFFLYPFIFAVQSYVVCYTAVLSHSLYVSVTCRHCIKTDAWIQLYSAYRFYRVFLAHYTQHLVKWQTWPDAIYIVWWSSAVDHTCPRLCSSVLSVMVDRAWGSSAPSIGISNQYNLELVMHGNTLRLGR